jgi:hypothetical protein
MRNGFRLYHLVLQTALNVITKILAINAMRDIYLSMENANLVQIVVSNADLYPFVTNALKAAISRKEFALIVLLTVQHVKPPQQNAQVAVQTWFSTFSQTSVLRKSHVMGQTIGIILTLHVMTVQLKDARSV